MVVIGAICVIVEEGICVGLDFLWVWELGGLG